MHFYEGKQQEDREKGRERKEKKYARMVRRVTVSADPSAGKKKKLNNLKTKNNRPLDLTIALAQRSLHYGMYYLNADPRLAVVPRSEPTELRKHAGRPRCPPLRWPRDRRLGGPRAEKPPRVQEGLRRRRWRRRLRLGAACFLATCGISVGEHVGGPD